MSKLSEKLRKYRRLAAAFRSFSAYMKNGTYLPDWSLTTASLRQNGEEDAEIKSFLAAKRETCPLKAFILSLFRLTGRNCAGMYRCTKMILTEGGVVKGFDFGKKAVCSLFPSEEAAEQYLRRKEQAGAICPTAKTLDVQKEKCFVTEELLIDESTNAETKFDAILRFYKNNSASESYTQYSCPIFRSDEQVGQIFEKRLKDAAKTYGQLRTCIQHGDLWDGNIFLCDGTLKFIDFDKMKEHMCFYDILLFLFTEAFINGDTTLLKQYLSGAYHGTMCAILKADDSEVFDYETIFVIFLNEMFLDRFQSADHAFLMRVLDAAGSWGIRLIR